MTVGTSQDLLKYAWEGNIKSIKIFRLPEEGVSAQKVQGGDLLEDAALDVSANKKEDETKHGGKKPEAAPPIEEKPKSKFKNVTENDEDRESKGKKKAKAEPKEEEELVFQPRPKEEASSKRNSPASGFLGVKEKDEKKSGR